MENTNKDKPPLEKDQSCDQEDLDVTCKSSCGVDIRYHLHEHTKKIKQFFKRVLDKLKMILL